MSQYVVKYYFFTEIERSEIEEAVLHSHEEQADFILSLDDCEVMELYKGCVKKELLV